MLGAPGSKMVRSFLGAFFLDLVDFLGLVSSSVEEEEEERKRKRRRE